MSFRRRRGSARHRRSWDDYNDNWASVTVHWLPRHEALTLLQRKLRYQNRRWPNIRREFESAREAVADLVSQREQVSREIAEAQSALERLRAAMGDSERERQSKADRLALLEEWRRNYGGIQRRAAYPPSVRR